MLHLSIRSLQKTSGSFCSLFMTLKFQFKVICLTETSCSDKSINHNLYPAGIYLLKVNNRNTGTRCEICPKLTINTPERRHWRRSGVFIVNFEHISHLALVFLLLTLNK